MSNEKFVVKHEENLLNILVDSECENWGSFSCGSGLSDYFEFKGLFFFFISACVHINIKIQWR